jgi:hypothetical protein
MPRHRVSDGVYQNSPMVVQKNPESTVNNFPLREETTDGTIAAAKNWWINALPGRNCKDRVSIHQQ